MRRRTSALERYRHIDAIELSRAKHKLVGRLHLIGTIANQLADNRRRSVARQSAYASIALIIRADGVMKLSRTYQLDAEIGRHHSVRRSVETEVRLHGAGVQAEHHIVLV